MNDYDVIVICGGSGGGRVDAAFAWPDFMVSNYSDARRLEIIIADPRNKIDLPRVEQLLRTDVEEP